MPNKPSSSPYSNSSVPPPPFYDGEYDERMDPNSPNFDPDFCAEECTKGEFIDNNPHPSMIYDEDIEDEEDEENDEDIEDEEDEENDEDIEDEEDEESQEPGENEKNYILGASEDMMTLEKRVIRSDTWSNEKARTTVPPETPTLEDVVIERYKTAQELLDATDNLTDAEIDELVQIIIECPENLDDQSLEDSSMRLSLELSGEDLLKLSESDLDKLKIKLPPDNFEELMMKRDRAEVDDLRRRVQSGEIELDDDDE